MTSEYLCGSSSVGRASAFQAGCREFESRLPLIKKESFIDSFLIYIGVFYCPVWFERIEVLFGIVSNISAFEGEEIINLSVHQNGQIKHF